MQAGQSKSILCVLELKDFMSWQHVTPPASFLIGCYGYDMIYQINENSLFLFCLPLMVYLGQRKHLYCVIHSVRP